MAALKAWSLALWLAAGAAQAQFEQLPAPRTSATPKASEAMTEEAYRVDAARHLYAAYPQRIFKGKLPPFVYSVMMVQADIEADGKVAAVTVLRQPAADEVAPWVVAMVRRAGPFPPPAKLGGVHYVDIWLVDVSGQFQLDTLTEGQR